jgi:hypothetical protein
MSGKQLPLVAYPLYAADKFVPYIFKASRILFISMSP